MGQHSVIAGTGNWAHLKLCFSVIKPKYSQSSISSSHFQNPTGWRIFLWATRVVSVKPVQSPVLWCVEANMIHGGKSQHRKRRELSTGSWGLGAPHTLVAAIKSRATLSGLGFCLPEEPCVPAQTQGLSSFLSHEESEKTQSRALTPLCGWFSIVFLL